MSRLSQWTKNHSAIPRIVQARRHNYEVLLRELSACTRLKPLIPELSSDVCPWVFPVVFEGLVDAHLALRARGIPAVTWGGVRHPRIPSNAFADSDFLYDNMVFLPVHQCLTDEDIGSIVGHVKALVRN
jgi:dTDP-4-amino-4,6-dideoxygalactose transaminase